MHLIVRNHKIIKWIEAGQKICRAKAPPGKIVSSFDIKDTFSARSWIMEIMDFAGFHENHGNHKIYEMWKCGCWKWRKGISINHFKLRWIVKYWALMISILCEFQCENHFSAPSSFCQFLLMGFMINLSLIHLKGWEVMRLMKIKILQG